MTIPSGIDHVIQWFSVYYNIDHVMGFELSRMFYYYALTQSNRIDYAHSC